MDGCNVINVAYNQLKNIAFSLEKPLSLRKMLSSDEPFLRGLFKGSLLPEFSMVSWASPLQEEAFYINQFNAQSIHFKTSYNELDYSIIEIGGSPIGRLILSWKPTHMHLVDFILLPEHQRQGIGTKILTGLISEVDRQNLTASVYFEKSKPHMEAVYGRYGFTTTEELEMHWYMERDSQGGK